MKRSSFAILQLVLAGSSVVGVLPAQSTAVGVSSVRATHFPNELLPFFEPEPADAFGYALAAGDFNGDGVRDLATGIPYDDGLALSPSVDCGAVVVRYGVPAHGLETGLAETFLSPQAAGSPSPAFASELFGFALTAGDFNGDDIDDLAIGVPRDLRPGSSTVRPGGVAIHYGLPGGIQTVAEHFLVPGAGGVPGAGTHGSVFGSALAAGDFDGDDFDDLAIGASRASAGAVPDAGTVTVLHGGVGGLVPVVGYLVDQDAPGAPDVAEPGDSFGFALASGNFNGSSYDDLVIGVPGEDLGLGAFLALFGSEFGLLFNEHRWLGQGGIGPAGGPGEVEDFFAYSLAAGDFDGDGSDDLAVGTPAEGIGKFTRTGQLNVLYGDPDLHFDLARTQFFDQGVQGNETGDLFALALAAGDFDGDDRDDLAVGHPSEDSGAGPGSGAVTVLMGRESVGLCCRSRTIVAGSEGFPGDPFQEDLRGYGSALAAGDFDGDRHADLAVGAPFENVDGLEDAGAEMVLYGSLFSDGFETDDFSFWQDVAP